MKWFTGVFLLSFIIVVPELSAQEPIIKEEKQARPDTVKKLLIPTKKTSIFYVDQSAPAGGNGTVLQPFQKITTALHAATLRNQPVVVKIITGIYREKLEISNHTSLYGILKSGQPDHALGTILAGSVVNNGPFTVQIDHLRISNSESPGALVVINNRAKTILNHVLIDRATRYGVYQKGGTLNADTASVIYISAGMITNTERQNNIREVVSYGTGIFLSDVTGTLSDVELRSNVQGLVAEGAGTRLQINTLISERHMVNVFLKDYVVCNTFEFNNGLAGIEARNGANLQLQGIKILDNDFCGLSVHDGATVKGTDVTVLRTKNLFCAGNDERGGINVSVRRGGAYLELTQFELGHGDLCGLQLVQAKAKCTNGKIHHHAIGVHVKEPPPDFRYEDLMGGVIYQDNGRNLDAETLPVPHG